MTMFIGSLVLRTVHLKVGEKESIMSQSMQEREVSPSGQEFRRPWLKFLPLGWDFSILYDTHYGILYSHGEARVFQ